MTMESSQTYAKPFDLEERLETQDSRSAFQKIKDVYFKPKSFEKWKNGRVYEWIGAKYIQKAVMGTVGKLGRSIGRDEESGTNYFIGKQLNLDALETYERKTRFNEMLHAPQIIWNASVLVKYLGDGNYGGEVFWGSFFLALNSSCTIIQRYNRARVDNVIEKRYKKK
ncbi:hypothetical protein K9L67_03390 [Candidatus Woesearchaeota archaeon]|nr:hypothetical protein [Candidatus Woesearchaeota archaeon]MCF7901246.1 hypothetical protein [Candidatus Woesearchaeota archaeon]MCF8012847.1 hypothetical protein [Candidatus Woesearchaeota archaeon]